jgi:hypothetical protein
MKNLPIPATKLGNKGETARPASDAGMATTTTIARATKKDGAAAASSSGKKLDLDTLLKRCRSRAAAANESELTGVQAMNKALASFYHLHRRSKTDPAAKRALEREYEKVGIKTSRSTTTEFTPLVKLFLGKDLPRPTVSRLANTLRLAREEKVTSQDFVAFVEKNGGTAACARLVAQRRKAAEGAAEDPQGAAMKIVKERLAGAPKIKLPMKLAGGGDGLVVLLVKPAAGGGYAVVGQHPATANAVRKFNPVAAKPVGGVAGKRR